VFEYLLTFDFFYMIYTNPNIRVGKKILSWNWVKYFLKHRDRTKDINIKPNDNIDLAIPIFWALSQNRKKSDEARRFALVEIRVGKSTKSRKSHRVTRATNWKVFGLIKRCGSATVCTYNTRIYAIARTQFAFLNNRRGNTCLRLIRSTSIGKHRRSSSSSDNGRIDPTG